MWMFGGKLRKRADEPPKPLLTTTPDPPPPPRKTPPTPYIHIRPKIRTEPTPIDAYQTQTTRTSFELVIAKLRPASAAFTSRILWDKITPQKAEEWVVAHSYNTLSGMKPVDPAKEKQRFDEIQDEIEAAVTKWSFKLRDLESRDVQIIICGNWNDCTLAYEFVKKELEKVARVKPYLVRGWLPTKLNMGVHVVINETALEKIMTEERMDEYNMYWTDNTEPAASTVKEPTPPPVPDPKPEIMFYVRDPQQKVHVLETPENYEEERKQRLEDFKALDSQQQHKAVCGPRQNRPLV